MSKHLYLGCVCLTSLAFAGVSQAFEFEVGDSYIEVGGYLKNETAFYTREGNSTGQATSTIDTGKNHHGFDLLKFENSARFFFNGDIGEESSWHGDLNVIVNTEGVNDDYQWHRSYTQQDWLRELYIDTKFAGWDVRLGKQQVVWGTADGIKLLDIINPTDWREFNQNVMEDSRIPIWMINAERNVGDSGNFQFIVSQHEESKFAGLNKTGDYGHPFIFKGVDTITGRVNGFRNIAPAMGQAARAFDAFAAGAGFGALNGAANTATVQSFVSAPNLSNPGTLFLADSFAKLGCAVGNGITTLAGGANPNAQCLNTIIQSGLSGSGAGLAAPVFQGDNQAVTRAMDGGAGEPGTANGAGQFFTGSFFAAENAGLNPAAGATINTNPDNGFWNTAAPDAAFEYMPDTSFATFDAFVNLKTEYVRDYPSNGKPNFGFRYKGNTEGGTNWSVNYLYAYDTNPSIHLSMHAQDGTEVFPRVNGPATGESNVLEFYDANGGRRCANNVIASELTADGRSTRTDGCTLRFTETTHRIHNIGASFDTSVDNLPVPLVVRGEFLYQKDTRLPVIDRGEMAIGNITEALKMEKADQFKYVLGFDITVLTNLFVSSQFIQFVNLDYVDEPSARNADINTARQTINGTDVVLGTANYGRYTGDFPALHLTNGLKKGKKFENFVSLFFSKPYGPSQEHRWNNITIYEEEGGWWNRLDTEYTFTDNLIGTAEWNHYWGDENTLFGQLGRSSNVQLGVRYLF